MTSDPVDNQDSVPASAGLIGKMRNPLPEGTVPVGIGLGLSGICLYGFLSIASHVLTTSAYATFSLFWPLLFVGGPGFFLPLEQEVGRALAARRAHGEGGGPLVRRAGVAGFGAALVLVIGVITIFPAANLTNSVFDGNMLILYSLSAGLMIYFAEHLTRGTLSGNGRFRAYGILMGSEGVFRVVGALILYLAHVKDPGYFAMVMVLGSVLAIVLSLRGQKGLLAPGPHAAWSELSTALGFLLLTSVLTQALINVGPLAVKYLARTSPPFPLALAQQDHDAAGKFQNGVIIARVPLFLFQAVQAALLPKLARYASTGRHQDLRRVLRRLLMLVAGVGVFATVGAFLLGPLALVILFGPAYELGHTDQGMLAATASVFMVALVLTPALIALHEYWRALVGWIVASITFALLLTVGTDLYGRVERALLGSAVAASVVLAALLLPLLRHRTDLDSDQITDDFADAAIHVTGEP